MLRSCKGDWGREGCLAPSILIFLATVIALLFGVRTNFTFVVQIQLKISSFQGKSFGCLDFCVKVFLIWECH